MKTKILVAIIMLSASLASAQWIDACDQPRTIVIGNKEDSVLHFNPPSNPTPPDANPPQGPTENERVIFWIHGLGGDRHSWTKAANATEVQVPGLNDYKARKVVSERLEYSQYSLHDAAVDIQGEMKTTGASSYSEFGIKPTNNIVIGHSQGGIVSRYLDYLYGVNSIKPDQHQFGGIVTFSAPNKGAQVINNRSTLLLDFVNKSCNDALAGPLESKIPTISLETFLLNKLLRDAKDKACDIFSFSLAPFIMKDEFAEIGEDYAVGAAPINLLNSTPSYTPYKVASYGIEETGTEFWREVYSLEIKLPNEFPAFEADYDEQLVESAELNILHSQAKAKLYTDLWDAATCDGWQYGVNPIGCHIMEIANDHLRRQMDAWRTTLKWWQNANNYYLAAIGCLEDHSIDESYCRCKFQPGGQWFPYPGNPDIEHCLLMNISSSLDLRCEWVPKITYNFVHIPNDGVVSADTQAGFPGAQKKWMQGSNHQQARNDGNTKRRLNELFSGDYGTFFKTSER